MNKAIGLMGGSFDPIHQGHLHLASEIQAHYQLNEIRFIPCHQNPLKSNPPSASAEDRIQMLKLAIAPFKNFSIDLQEILNKAPSYTIDTLKALRDEQPNIPLAFIMAFDVFTQFTKWKDWQNILHYTHLIVATRPSHPNKPLPPELICFLEEKKSDNITHLHQTLSGHIFLKTLTSPLSISSTTLRQQIAEQQDISQWVPSSVKDYILSHHLYSKG